MSGEEELSLETVSWWLCGDRSDQESESDESLFLFFLEMNKLSSVSIKVYAKCILEFIIFVLEFNSKRDKDNVYLILVKFEKLFL